MIIIGIDPHKASLTAVAVDCNGETVARHRFAVNSGTATQLRKWSHRWTERRFAVEGARGLGRGIAQILLADSEHVVDVPSTLAVRVRVLGTGGGRKTDADDARAVALTALRHKGLHAVRYEDQSTILRLLSERRDDLVRERTRVLNRLHQLLRALIAGGVPTGLNAAQAAAALRRVRPLTATDACRSDLAKELLADLRRMDSNIKGNEAQMRDAVAATTLPQVHGISTVLTAKLLGHVGDISRFPSADHFASYTGTSPLAASSGETVRHRLNTGGNRQLNSVLHTVAGCQSRDPGLGKIYYEKKIAQGETPAEARRALKRRLANVIYRHIIRDNLHAPVTAT